MRKIILLLLSLLIFGFKSEIKQEEANLTDLTIILHTNEEIDEVMITDIGQQRERHILAFNDTIRVNFKDSINDLYNIWFLKNGEKVSSPISSSQLWLNGKNIIIKGSIDKKLIVDTIIGSDLYYNSKRTQIELRNLFKMKSDGSKIDDFLLKKVKENIENPFSLVLANSYSIRNQNNKIKLKQLQELIESQNVLIKNHSFFEVHSQLEKKLEIKKLNVENYKFYNFKNEIVKLDLKKNKKYLLDFWFVSCPPCIRDHKVISKKLNLLKEQNIELIGISTDNEHSKWKSYLKSNDYNWSNFRVISSSKTITEDFGISAFPTYVLIENDGEIKVSSNSIEDIENYITK